MSAVNAILRPAVDGRPPAEQWAGVGAAHLIAPPDQPRLRLVDEVEEIESDPLLGAPARLAVPITVDLTPAGVEPDRAAELTEQAQTWAPWFAQLLTEAIDGRRVVRPVPVGRHRHRDRPGFRHRPQNHSLGPRHHELSPVG